MVVIGLTGSFGTGKTYVANVFRNLGAHVLDADELAHSALKKGGNPYRRVVSRFGHGILNSRKEVDRRALGRIVFKDKDALDKLCKIIHPPVIKKIKEELKKIRGKPVKAIVIDAPLLVEVNLVDVVDTLIVVKASLKNQIKRCKAKLGLKRDEILRRIKMQLPIEKKLKIADFIIDNNGTKYQTRRQVIEVWKKLIKD